MRNGQSNNKNVRVLWKDLNGAIQRLAQLSLLPFDPEKTTEYRQEMKKLSSEVEQLQHKLADANPRYRDLLNQQERTSEDIKRALPADAVLVDVVEYSTVPLLDAEASEAEELLNELKRVRLSAFVVRPGMPVRWIDLGPVRDIEASFDHWYANLLEGDYGEERSAAADLCRVVWDKLNVNAVKAVFWSGDGCLRKFPLGVLPGRKPNTYLIGDLAIIRVPVPIQLPELVKNPRKREGQSSLLLVGDVDFDALPGTANAAIDPRTRVRGSDRMQYEPLVGTRLEVEKIGESFKESHRLRPINMLMKEEATETAVREEARKCRYLHFATHGFFAPQSVLSALREKTLVQGTSQGIRRRVRFEFKFNVIENTEGAIGEYYAIDDANGDYYAKGEPIRGTFLPEFHPGLLSGVALAGANRPIDSIHDDGILTALEIAHLDLRNVELATLSGCETGKGESAVSESLIGLQRAFHGAGARTVVASLWKVPDETTQMLMSQFYDNLWVKKMSKVEALRQAQISVIREGPGESYQPRYWAAWVISGAPGDVSQITQVDAPFVPPPAISVSTGYVTLLPSYLVSLSVFLFAVIGTPWVICRRVKRRRRRKCGSRKRRESIASLYDEIVMNGTRCPSCDARCTGEGAMNEWCESCGKKIPAHASKQLRKELHEATSGECSTCRTRLCVRTRGDARANASQDGATSSWGFCPRCREIECCVQGCNEKSVESVSHTVRHIVAAPNQGDTPFLSFLGFLICPASIFLSVVPWMLASRRLYRSDNCYCQKHGRVVSRVSRIRRWAGLPCLLGLALAVLIPSVFDLDNPTRQTLELVAAGLIVGGAAFWLFAKPILEGMLFVVWVRKKEKFVDEFWEPIEKQYEQDYGIIG